MLTLRREQVRNVDRLAVEELGLPGIVLMENAARSAAQVILDLLETQLHLIPADARAAVVCGGGNNAGDGYALARHLHNAGVNVRIDALRPLEHLEGDAAVNALVAHNMGLQILTMGDDDAGLRLAEEAWSSQHILVDALLGTGFQGRVRPPMDQVIGRLNAVRERAGVKVVALDVPSGLDCDTGRPSNATVQADVTVTFVAVKTGFAQACAGPYVGELVIGDIGVPPELVARAAQLD